MTSEMTNTPSIRGLSFKLGSAEPAECWNDYSGCSSVITGRDESLLSLPGAILASHECGAKGSLGLRRLTIWNGALFKVAYAWASWLSDSYFHCQGVPILSFTSDFYFSPRQGCQICHKLLSGRRVLTCAVVARSKLCSLVKFVDVWRDWILTQDSETLFF